MSRSEVNNMENIFKKPHIKGFMPYALAAFLVGIGTAAIAPVVISYIVTEFPPDKIAKGFALYMFISSISVIFGPTIGGLIIKYYGWRTMIWVCAAISAVVFLLCAFIRGKKYL